MKALLIICDGVGGRPTKELKGKTSLQAAKHKNLDLLSKNGSTGIMDIIRPGIRPGSDTAHLALLGYDPYETYTGRGPFEASGIGMDVLEGDVAFRCNFATVKNGKIIDRRAGRDDHGLEEIAEELTMNIGGIDIIFKHSVAHRGALLLRGPGISDKVTDTDPHEDMAKTKEPVALEKEALRTAEILKEYLEKTQELLEQHRINKERVKKGMLPANILLLRGPGLAPKIESFEEKYGIKGGCVTATGLIAGVTKLCGLETKLVKGGDLDSDLGAKADLAIDMLKEKDFCLLHVKGCDNRSHDGDAKGKVRMIEKIDVMIGKLAKELPKDTIIAVCADHTTPLEFKNHTADPVPLLIAGSTMRKDRTKAYDEIECASGAIGRIRGKDLLPILLDLIGKNKLFGA